MHPMYWLAFGFKHFCVIQPLVRLPYLPNNEKQLRGNKYAPCGQPFKPQSHQLFHLVLAMKLLGIMLRNRCWLISFYTIPTGDANGWCQKLPVNYGTWAYSTNYFD